MGGPQGPLARAERLIAARLLDMEMRILRAREKDTPDDTLDPLWEHYVRTAAIYERILDRIRPPRAS